MIKNKKIRKSAFAIIAVLLIASGCGQANNKDKDAANDGSNNNPPVIEQPQNEQGNNPDNSDGTDKSNDENTPEGQDHPPVEQPDNSDAVTDEASVSAIIEKLTTDIEMGPLLTLQDNEVKDLYGIDPAAVLKKGAFMPAMMNVNSYEITVVELKSEENYDEVKAAMEQRAKSIQKTFETYLPDQYEASKQYQIVRHGNFVMFTISPDQEKAAEIFASFFKE